MSVSPLSFISPYGLGNRQPYFDPISLRDAQRFSHRYVDLNNNGALGKSETLLGALIAPLLGQPNKGNFYLNLFTGLVNESERVDPNGNGQIGINTELAKLAALTGKSNQISYRDVTGKKGQSNDIWSLLLSLLH